MGAFAAINDGAVRAERMTRLRFIFGGLSDSAFAALSTFTVGLVAIRLLPDAGVALFSLMLTGYVIGMVLPRNIVLTHIELIANRSEELYVPRLRDSLLRARFPLAFAFAFAFVSGAPVWNHVTSGQYASMGLGAGVAALSGAMLAHIRATMHVVRLHEWAGLASLTQFIVTVGLILVGYKVLSGTGRWALPFGALAAGQIVAICLWRAVVRRRPVHPVGELTRLNSRMLYLVPVGAGQLAIYAQSGLVVSLMGPAAAASLESARVAASPVYILASGLGALLIPPLVRRLSKSSARATLVGLMRGMLIVAGAGLTYAATLTAMGTALSTVLGRHVDALLAGARAAAFSVEGPTTMNLGILIAIHEFIRPAWLSVVGAGISLSVTFLLISSWGLYSVPAGQLASAATQLVVGLLVTSQALDRRGCPTVGHRRV